MKWINILSEMTLVFLAVFGTICIVRLLLESILGGKEVGIYIIVTTKSEADDLDFFLDDARNRMSKKRNVPILVLFSGDGIEYINDERVIRLTNAYSAKRLIVYGIDADTGNT